MEPEYGDIITAGRDKNALAAQVGLVGCFVSCSPMWQSAAERILLCDRQPGKRIAYHVPNRNRKSLLSIGEDLV
jgi:hypothetical protein